MFILGSFTLSPCIQCGGGGGLYYFCFSKIVPMIVGEYQQRVSTDATMYIAMVLTVYVLYPANWQIQQGFLFFLDQRSILEVVDRKHNKIKWRARTFENIFLFLSNSVITTVWYNYNNNKCRSSKYNCIICRGRGTSSVGPVNINYVLYNMQGGGGTSNK